MINTLKNSIFKNLIILIRGPIILLNTNDGNLTFKNLENINPLISFVGFRLNHKIYSKKQVKDLKKISYIENVSCFHGSLRIFTKMPYYKLSNKKRLSVSK